MTELTPRYLPIARTFAKGKRWRPGGNKPYLEVLLALCKLPESVVTFDKVLNVVPERRRLDLQGDFLSDWQKDEPLTGKEALGETENPISLSSRCTSNWSNSTASAAHAGEPGTNFPLMLRIARHGRPENARQGLLTSAVRHVQR